MLFLEKAFLPIFLFLATVSGLAFGSMIPVLFLVMPILVMPLLMYCYTQVYKQKYKTLSDDLDFDLSTFSISALGMNAAAQGDHSKLSEPVFESKLNRYDDLPVIIEDSASLVAQEQIANISSRHLPEIIDAMPSNGSATQHFTAYGPDHWIYRFHFKSVAAEFNAVGIGGLPAEAFAVARQVLERQIREWHIAREKDLDYFGEPNTDILQNLQQAQNLRTFVRGKHKQAPTVLIVEDDMDVATATESIFKQLGCKTILSDGHDGASHKMSFQDVDFIVLDWILGDNLSADELVKKSTRIIDAFKDLRARFQHQHAKVITYSALDKSKVRLPDNEYFDHLDHWQKPVNYSELARRASDMLTANGY